MSSTPGRSMERRCAGFFISAILRFGDGLRQRLCGHPSHAAQDGFDGPVALGVGEEDFARAADLGAVVPALEESEMALADGGGGSVHRLHQFRESRFHAGFEDAACGFWGSRGRLRG